MLLYYFLYTEYLYDMEDLKLFLSVLEYFKYSYTLSCNEKKSHLEYLCQTCMDMLHTQIVYYVFHGMQRHSRNLEKV